MEKIGMYNRQGILTRRDKRIVDKNHTFKPVQEHREITKATYVKDRINSKQINGFKKVSSIDASLQLKMKQKMREEEMKTKQREDREMMLHLKRQLEKEAMAQRLKRENMAKVSRENIKTAVFKKNVKLIGSYEDKLVDLKSDLKHDYGPTTSA